MKYKLNLQNVKCGGCSSSITNAAINIEGITNVVVDENESTITFETDNENQINALTQKLSDIGYPLTGETNSTIQKAKSYVSCMIGRVS